MDGHTKVLFIYSIFYLSTFLLTPINASTCKSLGCFSFFGGCGKNEYIGAGQKDCLFYSSLQCCNTIEGSTDPTVFQRIYSDNLWDTISYGKNTGMLNVCLDKNGKPSKPIDGSTDVIDGRADCPIGFDKLVTMNTRVKSEVGYEICSKCSFNKGNSEYFGTLTNFCYLDSVTNNCSHYRTKQFYRIDGIISKTRLVIERDNKNNSTIKDENIIDGKQETTNKDENSVEWKSESGIYSSTNLLCNSHISDDDCTIKCSKSYKVGFDNSNIEVESSYQGDDCNCLLSFEGSKVGNNITINFPSYGTLDWEEEDKNSIKATLTHISRLKCVGTYKLSNIGHVLNPSYLILYFFAIITSIFVLQV